MHNYTKFVPALNILLLSFSHFVVDNIIIGNRTSCRAIQG